MKHQVDFLELLQIDYEKYPVIAVVGGGGKTSLIYRLTDELIDKGKRVIITTTTHMAGESELPFARGGDAVRVKELLDKERYVIAAEYEEDTGKYASLTEEKTGRTDDRRKQRSLWMRDISSVRRDADLSVSTSLPRAASSRSV